MRGGDRKTLQRESFVLLHRCQDWLDTWDAGDETNSRPAKQPGSRFGGSFLRFERDRACLAFVVERLGDRLRDAGPDYARAGCWRGNKGDSDGVMIAEDWGADHGFVAKDTTLTRPPLPAQSSPNDAARTMRRLKVPTFEI